MPDDRTKIEETDEAPKRPYKSPTIRQLGALEVITEGRAGGSTPDRRTGARTKRGRR